MGTVSFAVEIKKVQKLGYIQFLRLDHPILWWVQEIRDTWGYEAIAQNHLRTSQLNQQFFQGFVSVIPLLWGTIMGTHFLHPF
jgi:hypothetical protein